MTPRLIRVACWFTLAVICFAVAELAWIAGGGSGGLPLGPAVATAVVVAVLLSVTANPIDRLVDRLTLGGDDTSAVHDLLRRMSDSVPVDEVLPRLAEATSRSAGRSRAEVEVLLAHGTTRAQMWPPQAPAQGAGITVAVRHAGTAVGRLTVDLPDGEADSTRRLLDELAGPAGVALATVRLTDDLRDRRAALHHTTQALLRAHERLQQVRRTEQERLRAEVDRRVLTELRAVIDDLREGIVAGIGPAGHIEHALDELRAIVRGIYPPRLDEAGLPTALRGWRDRRGVPAAITVEETADAALAIRPELRTCLYFCAVTLLDSADASSARDLHLTCTATERTVTLQMTGTHAGPGMSAALQVCRDRAEAFDGWLDAAADPDQTALAVAITVPVELPT